MPRRLSRLIACGVVASAGLAARAPAGETCPPDFDNTGIVDINDFLALLAAWGLGGVPEDINQDGTVDIFDLVILLDCFGPCPCPLPGKVEIFEQIVVVDATGPEAVQNGLLVSHLYATGPLVQVGDELLAVGEANFVAQHGTFFQNGGAFPPTQMLCDILPTACLDTFFTNNLLVDDGMSGTVSGTPATFEGPMAVGGDWFSLDPLRQAVDISDVTGIPGQAGVLIAQLSMQPSLQPGPSSVGFIGGGTLFAASSVGGTTMGTSTPVSFAFCPWDCADGNGFVDTVDFLQLLAEWGMVLSPCDFDGNGVDTVDFLALLEHFEPCP